MLSKFKKLSSVVAFLFLLTAAAFGQETTGIIEGTVKDPQGNVVPGAQVTVSSTGRTAGARSDATSAFNRTVMSDQSGFFRVLEVPPGFYSVKISPTSGFSAVEVPSVEVVLGKTTPINITLQAGNVQEVVTVTADAVAIDPTDTKIQTNITAQIAELLPKGTNFTSLLKVSPATRPEPLAGGFQVDGASGSENTFIIDGQEVTNFRTGILNNNNNLPFQLVQEVQIKSSGFEAEFGGATGGVINVVTKGGSNEWHGEFGIQFEPHWLQAGPNPTLRLFRSGTQGTASFFQTAEYARLPRDKGTNYFPTATLSGPVFKDKLWFFASYSPQFFNVERTIPYVSSDPRNRTARFTEVYNAETKREYGLIRLDSTPFESLRLTGSFTWNPTHSLGVLPGATQQFASPTRINIGGTELVGPQILEQQGGRINSNNVIGQGIWTPTSNVVVTVRGGRSFLNEKVDQAGTVFSYGVPLVTRIQCFTGAPVGGCVTGQQNVNTNNLIDHDVSIRKTFDADVSYLVSNFGGRHQFKGGFQYNGVSNDVNRGYKERGIVLLDYGLPINELTGRSDLVPTPGNLGSGELYRISTVGAAASSSQSLFFQDSWQPVSRLTLNLGLRMEREQVPAFSLEGNTSPAIEFSFADKLAPRIGVAYDLTGDGKTKLFGFYGWFYDRFKYELPRGSFGGDFFTVDYFEILPSMPNYLSYTLPVIRGTRPENEGLGGNCPIGGLSGNGLTRCTRDFRVASNAGLPTIEVGGIEEDLQAARQSEFTVGLERDLGGGFLFSGRYTHKQVDRAIEDVGFLNPGFSEAYFIANPGFGITQTFYTDVLGLPPTPKAVRKYDALELRIDKRFARNYYFNANYTYSRLFGNYAGLASSDETGRNSPNVNRLFDQPWVAFTASGEVNNGRLQTDRPHVFKFYGAYTLQWNEWFGFGNNNTTEFSAFTTAQSGTPLTTFYDFAGVTSAILHERGDLGRTPIFTGTDFAVRHKYRFGENERFTFVFDLDILNLFNERNVLSTNQLINARNDFAELVPGNDHIEFMQNFFNRDVRQLILNDIAARPYLVDASYNLPNTFQAGRSIRFGFRLLF